MKFHILRHQLQVKTCSMNGFGCVINYGLKPVAWFAFGVHYQLWAKARPVAKEILGF